MSRWSYSPWGIIGAILRKDLRAYSRNKVYLFLTVLSLVFFVLIFWVIPDTVEENIMLGMAPPLETVMEESVPELIALGIDPGELNLFVEDDLAEEAEGIELVELEDEAQLRSVIEGELELYRDADGDFLLYEADSGADIPDDAEQISLDIGLVIPEMFIADMVQGNNTTVTIFTDAAVPEEIQLAMQSFARELAFQFAGRQLPVEFPEEEVIVLGEDRAGEQIPFRDRMKPLFALFILMVETFAMASLISTEVLQRTVTALRVTPMKIVHFLTAKTIFGTGLALGQGLLILALIGAFTLENWPLLTLTMFLGAVLFTSLAMIIGSAGKDFMGQLMHAMIIIIPLIIPAFAVLFPGTAATWVQIIPSYPVVDLLVGITIYEMSWSESWWSLVYASLWVVVLYMVGLIILKRKVETL